MKRHKPRKSRKLMKQARGVSKKLKWDDAVSVLTVAITKAIWREGGEYDDARATADIVHHAICMALDDYYCAGRKNVVPFRRKRSYFRG